MKMNTGTAKIVFSYLPCQAEHIYCKGCNSVWSLITVNDKCTVREVTLCGV